MRSSPSDPKPQLEAMNVHPTARRRYIHIFPRSAVFEETQASYRSASARMPWMSVDDLEWWHPWRAEWFLSEIVLIFWGLLPDEIPADRKAAVVFRFTESVGDPELLTKGQADSMRAFALRAREPDLMIAGSPVIADYWSRMCRRISVAPSGYEAAVSGTPDWSVEKKHLVSFRGSHVDRRIWIVQMLQETFDKEFLWIKAFGNDRKRNLDLCKADLYLGHSEDYGFPGTRLWHAIASSAALITERRDAWPAVANRHYVTIESASQANVRRFVNELREILLHYPLEQLARTAHEELSQYTIDRCMEDFVVPATKGLGG